ncbi:MAG TPA: RIP metalloprotease RseP [Chloroflexia bacterium]|nr:RIP metalloprotease RseP [Chloroflexia bacterium]
MDFNWLWVVPVLGVLIVVHEMGHFFTAIWLGIKVQEFGIGFPPRAFAIRRNGIDYSINWLPIGGFVKIEGENGDSDDPRSFGRAPAWKRIIVLAAGSFMNLLLALIIFTGMSVSGTREIAAPDTGVSTVVEGRPAAQAGLQPGDRILEVGGQQVNTSSEVRSASRASSGKPTAFLIDRNGERITLTVTPSGDPPLGISLAPWVSPVKVGGVSSGGAADKAGLKAEDQIVAIGDTKVTNLPQALYLLDKSGTSAQITVERNGQRLAPVTVTAAGTGAQRNFGFGFFHPTHMVYYSPLQALGKALGSTWDVITSIPRGMAQAIEGKAQGAGVTGIVGITQLTGEVAQESGTNGLLTLTALLGISLFMINLLPLPALDGGRLLFIFIELLRGGRRIAPEKEGLVHFAGMVVLLALMAVITFFDVGRLLGGESILPR